MAALRRGHAREASPCVHRTGSSSLRLVKCENHGDASEEYLILKVNEDCNLASFAIYDATFVEGSKLSNKMRHFYRFPDHIVRAGEFVFLRTMKGENGKVKNTQDQTVHRFYWNMGYAVRNDTADAAVLIKISATEAIRAK